MLSRLLRRERRAASRQTVRIDAIVAAPDLHEAIDCTILDMNRFGARLGAPAPLPESFVLVDMLTRTAYPARPIWREDGQVGVRFEDQFPIGSDACPAWLSEAYQARLAREAGEGTAGGRP